MELVRAELLRQENVLNQLHHELNSERNSKSRNQDKEELVWEVQRFVTQLKRKVINVLYFSLSLVLYKVV